MKNILFILLMICYYSLTAQTTFEKYFFNNSLRIDFILAGDAESESAYLIDILKEPYWGGTQTKLIDPFDYGEYRFEVIDKATQKRIYTKGFCTFFEEWQTTNEAKKMEKAFYEVITFPCPKNKVVLNIYSRKWEGNFEQILSTEIDPNSYLIKKSKPFSFKTEKWLNNGETNNKVDIAFLADGYSK
jgi:peptidase M64-like protein